MKRIAALFALAMLAFAFQVRADEPAKPATEAAKPAAEAAKPAAEAAEAAKPALNETQKFSYAMGMSLGQRLKMMEMGEGLDLQKLAEGMQDAYADKPTLITEEEAQKVQQEGFAKLQQNHDKKMAEVGAANAKAGEEFLAANAKKDGVKVTTSGLQYEVITEGTGPKPKPTDTVKVNYRGTFLDGKEFDSSYKRNEPVTFPLNQVIPGWTEGVALMPVGSKYRFYVPAKLAYGEEGRPGIPPSSALIFDVELLSIEKAAPAPAHPGMGEAPMEEAK